VWPLPVLQTFRGKEPLSRHGGFNKEWVIVPGPGVEPLIKISGFDAPASGSSHRQVAVF